MGDEIMVENSLSADGLRRLHVMGNHPPGDSWLDHVPDGMKGNEKRVCEAGTHHLVVEWMAREMVIVGEGLRVMLWALDAGKVTPQIIQAGEAYALASGIDPQWAFVPELPVGAEEFVEVQIPGTPCQVMVILAGWVPVGFVAIR